MVSLCGRGFKSRQLHFFTTVQPASSAGCFVLFSGFRLSRVFEECEGQMAVAVRILVEIVLMIVLGSIEVLKWLLFNGQWLFPLLLFGFVTGFNDGQVGLVDIVDARTVLRAAVVPLLVDTQRVNGLEIEREQELEAHLCWVVADVHGLSKTCLVSAHLFVSRVLRDAVGISHFGVRHSFHLLEIVLGSPKAASGEIDFLDFACCHNVVGVGFFTYLLAKLRKENQSTKLNRVKKCNNVGVDTNDLSKDGVLV